MLALALLLALAAASPADEAAIRAVRAETNAAIAAHDSARLAPAFLEDVVLVAGNGDAVIGRAAMLARFGVAFDDDSFVDYLRTPDRIDIAAGGDRAAERGHWAGHWHGEPADRRVTGVYLAYWVRLDDQWRIRAETYVTLVCEGAGCPR
jgi:uncharacterized protein (TIGR02246 family)